MSNAIADQSLTDTTTNLPTAAPDSAEAQAEKSIETWILVYLFGGVFVVATSIMRILDIVPVEIAQIPAMIGATILGLGLAYQALRELRAGKPSTSSLAALAILAAFSSGMYEVAGYVAFILLVFDQALRRTAWGARRAIEELVGLTPDIARIIRDGQETEAHISDVKTGDIVRVRAGENLPVDGVITQGSTMINQASLTGEALPVEAEPGREVYAGTTNLSATIELRTTSVGEDSTIGKVAELISEAESTKTDKQLLIEQVARPFVLIALAVAGLVLYITDDFERAITVLIVVCPASLLLASPTAMMAAFAAAARLGIMIKQTSYLEAAADVDSIVFDKTGTLTTGRFEVSRLAPAEGIEGVSLLQAATDAEADSNHPLARSILTTATRARVKPADARREEVPGAGVKATLSDGTEILAGRPSWLISERPDIKDQVEHVESTIEGMSGVHVLKGNAYLGAVGLEDRLRYNAKPVIEKLRDLGARAMVLLTGDRLAVAKRVGTTVKVDRVEAECLPEEKHEFIKELVTEGRRVLMVGDGINDGPSLAAADVGVAMGLSGSDIATNSAGVALMTDDISRVPFLVMLSRKTRAIVAQNIAASILLSIIGIALAATGYLAIWMAVGFYIVGPLFVIFNSFRLFRFGEEFTEPNADNALTQATNPDADPEEQQRATSRVSAAIA